MFFLSRTWTPFLTPSRSMKARPPVGGALGKLRLPVPSAPWE